eukprot:Rhum_TRINITY_DN8921_c0_g2::Rhum_TRINITY_DN8921_c0_g2_i1::g.30647::m.30647
MGLLEDGSKQTHNCPPTGREPMRGATKWFHQVVTPEDYSTQPQALTLKAGYKSPLEGPVYGMLKCSRITAKKKKKEGTLVIAGKSFLLFLNKENGVARCQRIAEIEMIHLQELAGGRCLMIVSNNGVRSSRVNPPYVEPDNVYEINSSANEVHSVFLKALWRLFRAWNGTQPLQVYKITANVPATDDNAARNHFNFSKDKTMYRDVQTKLGLFRGNALEIWRPPPKKEPPPPPPPPPPVVVEAPPPPPRQLTPEPETESEETESESEPDIVPVVEYSYPQPEYQPPAPQEPRMLMPQDMVYSLRQPAPVLHRVKKPKMLAGAPRTTKPPQQVYLHLYMHKPQHATGRPLEIDNDLPLASPVAFHQNPRAAVPVHAPRGPPQQQLQVQQQQYHNPLTSFGHPVIDDQLPPSPPPYTFNRHL